MLRLGRHQLNGGGRLSGNVPRRIKDPGGRLRASDPGQPAAVDDRGQRGGRGTDRQPGLHLQGSPVSEAHSPRLRGQAGFTLIELLIASALGILVMTALTSVVLTT